MFKEGPTVLGHILWSEFKACLRLGLDPDAYFAKDRAMRKLITGGVVADSALDAMSSFDRAKEQEAKRKVRKGK